MNYDDIYKFYKNKTKNYLIEELLYKCNSNYKLIKIIRKAIEYIENNSAFLEDDEYELFNKKELLDILKGDSNESK